MNVQLTFVFKFFDLVASPLSKGHNIANGFKKQRTLYTVLRSPHIDKKSREQFKKEVYQQLVHLTLPLSKARAFFMSGLAMPSLVEQPPLGNSSSRAFKKSDGTEASSLPVARDLPGTHKSRLRPQVHVKIKIHYKTYEN